MTYRVEYIIRYHNGTHIVDKDLAEGPYETLWDAEKKACEIMDWDREDEGCAVMSMIILNEDDEEVIPADSYYYKIIDGVE